MFLLFFINKYVLLYNSSWIYLTRIQWFNVDKNLRKCDSKCSRQPSTLYLSTYIHSMFSKNKYLGLLLANIHSTPTHCILNTNYHQTQKGEGGGGRGQLPQKKINKYGKFVINQNHQTPFSLNSFFLNILNIQIIQTSL